MSASQISLVYVAITLAGFGPLLSAILAGFIGNCLGCNINEGGTDPCHRWGMNFGKVLNAMFVFGWLVMVTLPVALLLGTGFTIYLLLI